jgi:hypothetical protein
MLLLLLCFVASTQVQAQQDRHRWNLQLHSTLLDYRGELSRRAFTDQTRGGLGLGLERFFGEAVSLRLEAGIGQIQANDRMERSFVLPSAQAPNARRALNVQTDFGYADLQIVFHGDRPGLFGSGAWLSPYAYVGFGVLSFTPRADLLRDDRTPYYYYPDGSIRIVPADAPGALSANIVEQDGDFETDLADLNLEAVDYTTTTWSLPLGLGLKLRLAERWTLCMEGHWRYTGTDYLDDVGGNPINPDLATPALEYAADPAKTLDGGIRGDKPGRDAIFGMSLRVGYAFGRSAGRYRGPRWFAER